MDARRAPQCQVAGCTAQLLKDYCINRRLCQEHIEAAAVQRRGHADTLWRFCFQCGKLEPVEAFESNKRSCRARLARRKQRAAARSKTYANLLRRSSSGGQGAPAGVQPATSDGAFEPPCSSGDSAGAARQQLRPRERQPSMDLTSPVHAAHATLAPQLMLPAAAPQPPASMAPAAPLPPAPAMPAGALNEALFAQLMQEELGRLMDGTSSAPAQAQQVFEMHSAPLQPTMVMQQPWQQLPSQQFSAVDSGMVQPGTMAAAAASAPCMQPELGRLMDGASSAPAQAQHVFEMHSAPLQPTMVMQQPWQQLPSQPLAVDSGMVQPGTMAAAAASSPCTPPPASAGTAADARNDVSVAALRQQCVQVQNMLLGLSQQLHMMEELQQAIMLVP